MRNTFNLAWKLFVIALVAGLVLGFANEVTKKPIAEQTKKSANEARSAAFPGSAAFEAIETNDGDNFYDAFNVFDRDGNYLGIVASSKAHGYGGDIEVVVGMDTECNVVGIVIGANGDFSETAGLGAKVKEKSFAEKFLGIKYDGTSVQYNAGGSGYIMKAGSIKVEKMEAGGSGPDAVSGATYSSNAVIEAFNNAADGIYELLTVGSN